MNNYAVNYQETPNSNNIKVTGRFNRANYEANKQFTSVEKIKSELALGT